MCSFPCQFWNLLWLHNTLDIYTSSIYFYPVWIKQRRNDDFADGNRDSQEAYDDEAGEGTDGGGDGGNVMNDVTVNGEGSGSHSPHLDDSKAVGQHSHSVVDGQ